MLSDPTELPGVLDIEQPEHDNDDEQDIEDEQVVASVGGSGVPDGDEEPFTKTYVAIDGVDYDDFTQEEREAIERHLKEVTIFDQDKQTTNVRVLDPSNVAVMEVHRE